MTDTPRCPAVQGSGPAFRDVDVQCDRHDGHDGNHWVKRTPLRDGWWHLATWPQEEKETEPVTDMRMDQESQLERARSVDEETRHEHARVRNIVARIRYRPAYRFRADLDVTSPGSGRVFIQVQHLRPDVDTQQEAWGSGGKVYLSPHATEGEILRKCFGAALAYEEHEVREWFKYAPYGCSPAKAIFGPHIDVAALWSTAHRLDVR